MTLHDLLYLLAMFLFLALPVLLALKWGDRIAEMWDRRRFRRRQSRRNRISLPEALPDQGNLLANLKAAEERCEGIDLQLSERLLGLQRLTVSAYKRGRSGSAADLLKPANALETLTARKEGYLNLLLDIACLQSDRIDAMTSEVDALSKAVGWSPAPAQTEKVSSQPNTSTPDESRHATAADHLLKRIEEAAQKRRTIDERLKQIKSWRPPNRSPQPQSPPPDPDAGPKGSRFDVTIQ